jgi:hypothetical protein
MWMLLPTRKLDELYACILGFQTLFQAECLSRLA